MTHDRPLIAITTGATHVPIPEGALDAHYAGRAYSAAVAAAGGLPLLLPTPAHEPEAVVGAYLDRIDGLVLAGGIDIAPDVYGGGWPPAQDPDRPRDAFEVPLAQAALERGVPLLGICRGMQLLNVACGGTLHEHVEHEHVEPRRQGTFEGTRLHAIDVEPGSLAERARGRARVEVLCLHHQAPDRVGAGLTVTGRSDDGIVEALEATGAGFALGVQWHPEAMVDTAPIQARLYGSFVEAAAAHMEARP